MRGNLQEYAVIGAAFVELPGGVQEARAVSGGGSHLPAVADGEADLLDECLVGQALFYISGQRDVIMRTHLR